jgi:hypothetical protein
LFLDKLTTDSAKRLRKKFAIVHLTRDHVSQLLKKLEVDREYHLVLTM